MPDAELIILAGGASVRMGTDKLRLRDASGRLLVAAWVARMNWPALPRLVLPPGAIAPDDLAHWPTAHDAVAGDGPLRGVAAALAAAERDWLIIVAVDTPGIARQQIDWLLDQRQTAPAVRLWMLRRAGAIEPFPMLIHRDMTDAVTARLAMQRRSLHGLADEPAARVIEAPTEWPASVWANLNRPEDLARFFVPCPVSTRERK